MYASAGALSIKTAAPLFKEKSYNAYVKLKGGSFGLFNPVVRYEQRIGNRWSASLHADWLSAKGDYPFTLINGKEKPVRTAMFSLFVWKEMCMVISDRVEN